MFLALNSDKKSLLSRLLYEKTLFSKDQELEKSLLHNDRCFIPRELDVNFSILSRMNGILLTNELESKYKK